MESLLHTIGKRAQDPFLRNGLSLFANLRIPVRNDSGASIATAKLIYFSGYDAAERRFEIALADADDPAKQATGVTDHAIANASNSYIVVEALVGGLDTSGRAVGDPVYVSPTAGAFVFVAPSGASQFVQKIGSVKVVSATAGVIHFQTMFTLEKVGSNFFQADAIDSAAIDEQLVQYAAVSLTNAQVLALRATPITLVAAPGAGKMLEFMSAELIFDYTGAYTESVDNLVVRYVDGTGVQASEVIETTGFLDATADTATKAIAKADVIAAKTACENKALVLHNIGDGEFGGGHASNALRVKVAYRVHVTGW